MGKLRIGFTIIVLLALLFQRYNCYDDDEEDLDTNPILSEKRPRVDAGVKRPYRICQGFEDPEEFDCYMRSDVKQYVCTEPPTFNPCESKTRVTTYHYDHIRHRCDRINVPACSGQIIRAMTLIQCLIYCHNVDPYALGKSTSIVFKLNQKKPYVPKDTELEEREQASTFVSDSVKTTEITSVSNEHTKSNFIESDADLAKKVIKTFEETTKKETEEIKKPENVEKKNMGKDKTKTETEIKPSKKKVKIIDKKEMTKIDKNVKKETDQEETKMIAKTVKKNATPIEKKEKIMTDQVKSLNKGEKKKEEALDKKVVKNVEKTDDKTLDKNVAKNLKKKDDNPLAKKDVKTLEKNEKKVGDKTLDKKVAKNLEKKNDKALDKKDAKNIEKKNDKVQEKKVAKNLEKKDDKTLDKKVAKNLEKKYDKALDKKVAKNIEKKNDNVQDKKVAKNLVKKDNKALDKKVAKTLEKKDDKALDKKVAKNLEKKDDKTLDKKVAKNLQKKDDKAHDTKDTKNLEKKDDKAHDTKVAKNLETKDDKADETKVANNPNKKDDKAQDKKVAKNLEKKDDLQLKKKDAKTIDVAAKKKDTIVDMKEALQEAERNNNKKETIESSEINGKEDVKSSGNVEINSNDENEKKVFKPIQKKETKTADQLTLVDKNTKKGEILKNISPIDKKVLNGKTSSVMISKKEQKIKDMITKDSKAESKKMEQVKTVNGNDKKDSVATNKFINNLGHRKKDNIGSDKVNEQKPSMKYLDELYQRLKLLEKDDGNLDEFSNAKSIKKETDEILGDSRPIENNQEKSLSGTKDVAKKTNSDILQQLLLNEDNERKKDLFAEIRNDKKSDKELLNQLLKSNLITSTQDNSVIKKGNEFNDEEVLLDKKDTTQQDAVKDQKIVRKSDSTDKGSDDGFYLWDE